MTIRILADREPYSSFDDAMGPLTGSLGILCGPAGLDDAPPDILVLPAEQFLELREPSGAEYQPRVFYIPYGPVELMEKAFERGCSDYLREPWALPELRARVSRFAKVKFCAGERFLEMRGVHLAGETASTCLTEGERALLQLLVLNVPHPVPRDAAIATLERLFHADSTVLGHCISSLRRKLDSVEPGLGRRLLAIRGFGYRLEVSSCA